ncbi:MAG TPA: hypothetical protein VEC17_00920 [Candidatus Binatia bacterium]|nr:hypothetical protein [Candidatus Binatia bacterium]
MHYKYMVVGVVLIAAVIFGSIFWGDLLFNQSEISNLNTEEVQDILPNPAPESQQTSNMSSSDSYDSIEADLNSTNVNDIDSDNTSLEAELNAL